MTILEHINLPRRDLHHFFALQNCASFFTKHVRDDSRFRLHDMFYSPPISTHSGNPLPILTWHPSLEMVKNLSVQLLADMRLTSIRHTSKTMVERLTFVFQHHILSPPAKTYDEEPSIEINVHRAHIRQLEFRNSVLGAGKCVRYDLAEFYIRSEDSQIAKIKGMIYGDAEPQTINLGPHERIVSACVDGLVSKTLQIDLFILDETYPIYH
jgi:hypothetical protein